ncbi:exopolysaccharide biosynthesis polyprenyl glycosylphosphotransferase [Blastococcus tunisiensis]|uniref:Undecaprenyl-phosphate glucose phosphotransferase n=1 Tax=Blastococcus tunisiensis TaxID=1798228 RepID=A0A1I1XAD2_9ACTN|nr:exopolysaccharide biosynthesis polyprenyl glycosylphosphotransferase [Blastococcus sp. DSM 46838]SFE04329.1 Undecaprenyl-phosphate glucose phosphotransferase [Blastococcus sp. DSM 46838]
MSDAATTNLALAEEGLDPVRPPQIDSPHLTLWNRISQFGVAPMLVFLDGLAVVLGIVLVDLVGRGIGADVPLKKTAAFGVVLLALFWLAGLYRSRLSLSVLDDLPVIAGRWLAAVAVAVLGQIVWSNAIWQNYIIHWRFMWGAVAIGVGAVLVRALGYAVVRRLRSERLVTHRTLILGAGQVGNQVADILTAHPEFGLHPVGFLDADPWLRESTSGLPVLGGPESLSTLLLQGKIRNVVVAFSSVKEAQMVGLIRTCDRHECELFVVPRLYELHQVDGDMDTAWGMPLVRLRRAPYRSPAWRVKRLIDVLFSGGALLFLAPLMALLALAVRLDGGPGIIFRQERVGVDGRTFQVLKFRSLRPVDEGESATNWNIAHDDRLSTFGRLLRKSSLDELPQLFNILRGDMSLVGPRPERPHFVHQFRSTYPSYEARHRVPSGLTGWAQVHGLRGDTSIADRARFDNYYIENWSLWLDLKIILRTVSSVIRGAGG